jgi:hypothetical protein
MPSGWSPRRLRSPARRPAPADSAAGVAHVARDLAVDGLAQAVEIVALGLAGDDRIALTIALSPSAVPIGKRGVLARHMFSRPLEVTPDAPR